MNKFRTVFAAAALASILAACGSSDNGSGGTGDDGIVSTHMESFQRLWAAAKPSKV